MTLSWARKDFQVVSRLFWEILGRTLHPGTLLLLPIIVTLCSVMCLVPRCMQLSLW